MVERISDDELTRPPAAREAQRSVLRYTLLLAVAFLVGAPSAYLAWTNMEASYTAEGTLWIEVASRQGSNDVTPIRAGGLLESSAWIDLLRSYQVMEPVVMDQRLYVRHREEHAPAFASFTLAEQFVPGAYELRVGASGEDFVLVTGEGAVVQQGLFETPIGRNVGFRWTPSGDSFAPGATVEFSVLSVRHAARALSDNLVTAMDRDGNFLSVRLTGPDRQEVADVLNALMSRYVDVAAELKRSKLEATLATVEEQLQVMEFELQRAERELEEVRELQRAERDLQEGRLSRRVQTTESIYIEVRGRVETARLAATGSTPDIRILDRASVRKRP